MKIIRSVIAIIISLGATTFLHAQQTKPELTKPVEETRSPMPSPVPEFKPQPQSAVAAEPAAQKTEAARPAKEDALKPGKQNMEVKILNENDKAVPGGAEGKKILAGNKTKTDEASPSPSTATPPVAPPVTRPPAIKEQRQ